MKRLICLFKGHKRGETWSRTGYIYHNIKGHTHWHVKCKRCGYRIDYYSPRARLVGTEMCFGFDGE
jgi:hypothetical protein